MLVLFGKGFLFGLSVAAPVGPMALLCLRATLQRGFAAGMLSGLGIALADASYALLAALGLGIASMAEGPLAKALQASGGAYLAWLGWRTMLEPPATEPAGVPLRLQDGLLLTGRTYLLTMANPPTIMMFAAFFAGMGLIRGELPGNAMVVLGVLLGSLGWWAVFTGVTARLGHRLPPLLLAWINRVSGAILLLLALWLLLGVVRRLLMS